MESVDVAFEAFKAVASEIEDCCSTIVSEQDTRVKAIDRILIEVLFWSRQDIQTEEKAGSGFLDYRLTVGGHSRCIVEAKRDARQFEIPENHSGRAFKLNGVVFKNADVREGIEQAITYSAHKGAELAVVTNGSEWVVFRANRLADGTDVSAGMAFVFSGLAGIERNFQLFYQLLGRKYVIDFEYRAFFQEAEGQPIRGDMFERTLHPPETVRVVEPNSLTRDLDRLMTTFFRDIPLEDNARMLDECFVTTPESKIAEERIERISEELVGRIRDIDTDQAPGLTEIVQRVHDTHRNEFVVIVGTKGAGKSTFIGRFFRSVLPPEIRSYCAVCEVDLAESSGDMLTLIQWLDDTLLEAAEESVFGADPPSYDDLQAVYYDEYTRRMKGAGKFLYETNKVQFKIDFGAWMEDQREANRHDYVLRLLKHAVVLRRRLPCLIFDNADHFSMEFQQAVFQYARSVYEGCLSLVLIPITDRTSWQLSRHGSLESFYSETFCLPTPDPVEVIDRRIRFICKMLEQHEDGDSGGHLFGNIAHLSISNISGFAACLQRSFIGNDGIGSLLAKLANYDIRRCLDLARITMTSPHIPLEELVKTYIAGTAIEIPHYVLHRALFCGSYKYHPYGNHKYVQNLYCLSKEPPTSPLLGIRLLQMLRNVRENGETETLVTPDQILDYMMAMNFDRRTVGIWLDLMLKTGLCFCFDPTVIDLHEAKRLQISPSGAAHLSLALLQDNYMAAMLHIQPIRSEKAYHEINTYHKGARTAWLKRLIEFVDYLIEEDSLYCKLPEHPDYHCQHKIDGLLKKSRNRLVKWCNNDKHERIG